MKFRPKKTKFIKVHRPRRIFTRSVIDKFVFGSDGLIALESGLFDEKKMEIMRLLFLRYIKKNKQGKFLIRVFAHSPYSKRGLGIRMGHGASPLEKWVAVVKKGKIICEIKNFTTLEVEKIFRQIRIISNLRLKYIKKINYEIK